MSRAAITVPAFVTPCGSGDNSCCCRPKPIETTFKGGVVRWLRQPGDTVGAGEILCELEIEKAVVELPAPASGVLAELCVGDGEAYGPGAILGYLDMEAETA